jgi:imidazolonepropionase-like amidohydrolase
VIWLVVGLLAVAADAGAGGATARDAPAADARAAAGGLCLTGARLVDPERRTITPGDVAIADGRIQAVGPRVAARCQGKALRLDGLYVVPGFIDLHVHGWGNPSPTGDAEEDPGREVVARTVVRAGVLATADLAGAGEAGLALRDRLRGSPEHADLFVAGTLFRAAGGDVAAKVAALAPRRPDLVKLFARGEGRAATLGAAVAEARRRGWKTVVHIDDWAGARAAVEAGASAITHFEDEVTIPEDLVRAMAAKGIAAIPTMAVQCDLARIAADQGLLDDPLLGRVTTPALRDQYRAPDRFEDKARYWVRWQREGCVPHDFVSLRRLHGAGVRLLAGADTGNLGTFQGWSLHREMELMAEAGVPAWDALRAATTEAARFLGLPWGLRPGAQASLVVLEASPLEAIRNTRRIRAVVHHGRVVWPR